MKKLFLQKLFLHKSLSKGFLPKLLLLVVLFFGGCSTVSNDAIDTAKNKIGTYYDSADKPQTFEIDAEGLTYTDDADYILGYVSSGTNYIEYIGTSSDKTYIKVVLSNITEYNGIRIEYKKDTSNKESEHESGFTWYTSN